MQEKLILLKEQNKMTNKKMAEILGITPNQYRKKEKGEVQFKLNEMVNLSEYFGKTMDEIFLPYKHQNGRIIKKGIEI